VFAAAGYDAKQCLLASFGFGLVTFIFAFPAIYTMDTYGRRNLLLFTFPNMAWCLVAAGCCFTLDINNSARLPLIAFFVFLFGAFYGPGKPVHDTLALSMLADSYQALDLCRPSTFPRRFLYLIERLVRHARFSSTMPLVAYLA